MLTINDDDTAAIDLTKLTNGTNNNSPPGPTVPLGSTVTFTYVVSNAANDPLQGVVVRDDNGTPGNLPMISMPVLTAAMAITMACWIPPRPGFSMPGALPRLGNIQT